MNVTNAIFNRESQLWSWVERNCDKCRKGSHPMQGSPCKRTKATCRKAQELYARLDDELRPVRMTTARVCQHKQCPYFAPVSVPMAQPSHLAPTLFNNDY